MRRSPDFAGAGCLRPRGGVIVHPLYHGLPPGSAEFAGRLSLTFEEALTDLVKGLDSHTDLVHYAVRAGHRTRPVGCLLATSAVGGDWRAAINAALAVELIHKSSVIRDDIVDEDVARSGQPALHVAYGLPRAIAVSDLLWTLALQLVPSSPIDLQRTCGDALYKMASGQLEDVAPSVHRQDLEQRRLVEEQKTGVLSELACRFGALIGGGSPLKVEALSKYGRNLGTAFQILNDVRNLRGEEGERRPASDIWNRRTTVLAAYAREAASPEQRVRLDTLTDGSGDLSADEVESLRETILAAGAAEFGERTASALMEEARGELAVLDGSTAKDVLVSLTQDALLTYAF